MAKNEAAGGKPKVKRNVKPKALYMIFKGDIDVKAIEFTKDPDVVLEKCSTGDGTKYAKVTLPAPKPRGQAAA